MTDGPPVELNSRIGAIVVGEKGTHYQLLEHFSDGETADPKKRRESRKNPDNYYPAGGPPGHSRLVVKTSALRDLEERLAEPDHRGERPVEQRERTSLLAIIAALARLAKIDVTKPSSAAGTIENQTAHMGARVAARTIENHLKLIPEALERLSK